MPTRIVEPEPEEVEEGEEVPEGEEPAEGAAEAGEEAAGEGESEPTEG
jgi:hypothetical protein